MTCREIPAALIVRNDTRISWYQAFQDDDLNPGLHQRIYGFQVRSARVKNSSVHLFGAKHLGIAQFTLKEMTGVNCAMPRCFAPNRDRKSTRLNSSHPSISYAVFCLKKKKTDKCEE